MWETAGAFVDSNKPCALAQHPKIQMHSSPYTEMLKGARNAKEEGSEPQYVVPFWEAIVSQIEGGLFGVPW